MDIKCRVCLASSEAKMYHSLDSAFPAYLKSPGSVLTILEKVASSKVLISLEWPHEICTACLKSLKECHIFIEEFHKAQIILKQHIEQNKNSVFIKTEEQIMIKVEPPDEEASDPLQINGDSINNSQLPTKPSLKPILKQNIGPKLVKKTIVKRNNNRKNYKNVAKSNNMMSLDVVKNNKIDARILDHNYTRDPDYQIKDYELDSEESVSNDELENNTKNAMTAESSLSLQKPENKLYVMSVDDVLNIKGRTRKKPSLSAKSLLRPRSIRSKKILTATIQPKSDPLRVLVTEKIRNKTKALGTPRQMFKCNLCSNAYSTLKGLSVHKYVHTPKYLDQLKCKHCGYQCRSKSAFFYHKQKHIGKCFKCAQCAKSVLSKWQLMEHKRRMHGDGLPEKCICNECGKHFKYSNALKYHICAAHRIEDKEYLCGFCGYKCVTKTYLKRHERCHANKKPYKCKFCPSMFRASSELHLHQLGHENETKHLCSYCGKGFCTSWNLKVHSLQHDGSHKCVLCSKAFPDNAILKFHYLFRHKLRKISLPGLEGKSA